MIYAIVSGRREGLLGTGAGKQTQSDLEHYDPRLDPRLDPRNGVEIYTIDEASAIATEWVDVAGSGRRE